MMSESSRHAWGIATRETVRSYRRMIEGIVEQLSDEELVLRPAPDVNSVAVILRHLGGNLQSRWTDFLTTDGEKPERDREAEFADWEEDRQSLMDYFAEGWKCLEEAIDLIDSVGVEQTIRIRGEPHTVANALLRSLTHISYHVGQIAIVARMVHDGEWRWLTIQPGKSTEFNSQTWGTPASRAALDQSEDSELPPPANA